MYVKVSPGFTWAPGFRNPEQIKETVTLKAGAKNIKFVRLGLPALRSLFDDIFCRRTVVPTYVSYQGGHCHSLLLYEIETYIQGSSEITFSVFVDTISY